MTDPIPPRPDSPFPCWLRPAFRSGSSTAAPVPAGNGVTWWSEGWRYFMASPWVWIGITVAFVAIMILLSLVPIIGNVASTVLSPY